MELAKFEVAVFFPSVFDRILVLFFMDEDKEKTKSSDEHPIWQIVGLVAVLLIFGTLFQRVASFFSRQDISDIFSSGIFSLNGLTPFDPGVTAVGEPISIKGISYLFDAPGGDVIIEIGSGVAGVITGNPVYYGGEVFWPVEMDRIDVQVNGFVAASGISFDDGRDSRKAASPVGREVALKKDTRSYADLDWGGSARRSGGARGVIVAGPIFSGGERYWLVGFEKGADGYVAEGDLLFVSNSLLRRIVDVWKIIAIIVSLIGLTGAIYAYIRLVELRKDEADVFSADRPVEELVGDKIDPRWQRINNHIESENPSDWRLAILEADVVLDEMLQKMGYHGETMGDRLKNVEVSDFTTIELAWEAHKIRNRIAHSGGDFMVTQREARRVIELYRQVFSEFKMKTE